MSIRSKTLLVIPPFVQLNTPYPSTAYLAGYLRNKGYEVEQMDLSIELINEIFSSSFLDKIFKQYKSSKDTNIQRIYQLRQRYIDTVDMVMTFLRANDTTLATLICGADFLPQAARLSSVANLDTSFGTLGNTDCAKYLSTLYLQDLSTFIREVITPHFELVRYAEKISVAIKTFDSLESELNKQPNIIEQKMLEILTTRLDSYHPDFVGFSVPFPGNLLSTLRCSKYIKENHERTKIIVGGGYPNTELRSLKDTRIFQYIDYLILDDGELALERIISQKELLRTYTLESNQVVYHQGDNAKISHLERGCPDFNGLPLNKYISLTEVTNPMHRLWSDGRWNKMILAHGCYWAKCAFCDTSLDYICNYDHVDAKVVVDWMERIISQTGSRGFHFVDEAAPPKVLKELALELLRRKLKVSWWGNIRFESTFTQDLCSLLASSGCIAVSGGLEVASDRLLTLMNKGVTIEQATIAMRNFYYSGIMVHTYLMYGFPTETLQESVDSLEVVRQLFKADLINSAFWHRYAMTIHSPSGKNPEQYKVRLRSTWLNPFANNEIEYIETVNYNLEKVGEALTEATFNYINGNSIEKPVNKWFEMKVPQTTIEDSEITSHLIKPDSSRIFNENARLVWTGITPKITEVGLIFFSNSSEKEIKFSKSECDFLLEIIHLAADLNNKILFSNIKEIYAKYSEEPFVIFYHSKKWDLMRGFGLLQI